MRDVEVAAAEALRRPDAEDLEAIRARDVHGRGGQGAREGHRPRRRPRSSTCSRASAGPAGRWIHYGLTSSDVLDTALALQLRARASSLVAGARELACALAERAREHADTLCVGRTHGVHAEPTTFGLKLAGYAIEAHRNAERLERAFAQASVGAISGAVGTYATLGPDYEARVLGAPRPARASRSPPRSSRATATPSCCRRSRSPAPGSSASRPRSATSSAPRCARSRSRSAPGQKGSSAMPHKRNPIVDRAHHGLARVLRGYAQAALENVALWHERDISHSGAERVVLPDATILLDYMQRARAARRARHGRPRRPHAREPRAHLRRAVLPARAARARRGGHAARRRVPDRPAARPAGVGHADAAARRCSTRARRRARPRRGLRLRLLRAPRARGAGAAAR